MRPIKPYRDWSLKRKLLVIISTLLTVAVLVVVTLNYVRYSSYLAAQTAAQTQQIIEQIGINVDTYMGELFRLSMSPYYDDTVMRELEVSADTEQRQLEKSRRIEQFLGSVMILPREEILRVYILTDEGFYSNEKTPYNMVDAHDYVQTDWYQQAKGTQEQVFLPVHAERVFGERGTLIFSIVRGLRSKNDNSRVLGVIKVDASYDGIKNICDKVQLSPGSALLILDDDQNIIYRNSLLNSLPLEEPFLSNVLSSQGGSVCDVDGQRYVINTSRLPSTGWTVAFVNSFEALNHYSTQTRNASFLAAAICVLLSVSVLALFVRGFLHPVSRIVSGMKAVEGGDLTVRVPVERHDETGYLSESFNHMTAQVAETLNRNTLLVKEVYEARYLQKEAQYNALCGQIKPHFLYNTLNTISLLVKCGEGAKAVDDIESLSSFLRGVMHVDKEIPLSDELRLVVAYLSLQKSRYGEKLSYQIDVPDSLLSYRIPALSVEPLVENAVVHGCEQKRGSSQITVSTVLGESALFLYVRDSGAGIASDQLNELNRCLREESLSDIPTEEDIFTESIGLLNVNKRIKLLFGLNYGVQIFSEQGKGTEAVLSMPLPPEMQEGDEPPCTPL